MSSPDNLSMSSHSIMINELNMNDLSVKDSQNNASTMPASAVRTKTTVYLERLPSFKEVPTDVWPRLASQKLSQIRYICDFTTTISAEELQNRAVKTDALHHMVWYLESSAIENIPDSLYPVLLETVAANILRSIPPPMNPEGDEYDPEEDEDSLEPSWPHLCLVYDMFIKFLELPQFNSNLARKYIDLSFVTRLMALFDLEDPRERDIVKTALHRIYGKFLNLRPFIRKMMRSIFCELVYENVRHKIAEMLEILGRYPRLSIFIVCIKHCFSIINGFALPIRPEHRFFLEKSLIPLHKHRSLPCYQPQLAFCINQFIEKDQDLADMVVMGLLRIWPKINSNKEVLFLTEIEEILGMLDPEYFEPFAEPLFDRLALCIESCHFQVCEKALMFWHNDDVLELFKTQYQAMIEIVTPSILARSSTHWNSSVRLLMIGVLHIFVKLDAKLFEDCAFQYAIESHIDPIAERTEISNLLNIDLRAAANSDYPSGMDISRSDGESEKENPAGDLQEILPLIPGSVVRRKSMLPVDKDIAEALSNFRPSPPPSDIPDKGIII